MQVLDPLDPVRVRNASFQSAIGGDVMLSRSGPSLALIILFTIVQLTPTSVVSEEHKARETTDSADAIRVVPNPFIFSKDKDLHFTNVPAQATIAIYQEDGTRVALLQNTNGRKDAVKWTPKKAFGVYIYLLQSTQGKKIGKFVMVP